MVIVPLHSCGAFQVYALQSNLSSNFPIYSQIYLLYMSTSGFHIRCGGIRRSFTPEYSVVFHLKFMSFHSCVVRGRKCLLEIITLIHAEIYAPLWQEILFYFAGSKIWASLFCGKVLELSTTPDMFQVFWEYAE